MPATPAPLAQTSAATLDGKKRGAAIGIFKPDAGELGIKRYTAKQGDTAYQILRASGVDAGAIADNLAATPGLDLRAFVTRGRCSRRR